MKSSTPIWVILSLLWILGGSWLLSNKICGVSSAAIPTFSVSDGKFKTDAVSAFSFNFSKIAPNLTADNKTSLKAIAKYLNDNPNRSLILTGHASPSEKNKDFEDIGFARADKLKTALVAYKAPLNSIEVNSQALDNLTFVGKEKLLYGGVDFAFVEKKNEVGTSPEINYSETKSFSHSDIYSFPVTSKGSVELEMSTELGEFLDNVKTYLKDHKNASIQITGYTDDKGNVSTAGKWSKEVRNFLMDDFGLSKKIMKYDGKGSENPIVSNDDQVGKLKNNRVEIQIVD